MAPRLDQTSLGEMVKFRESGTMADLQDSDADTQAQPPGFRDIAHTTPSTGGRCASTFR